MTPLVVRPTAQATLLTTLLREQGHSPLCCPLLEIAAGTELAHLPSLLANADIVIAVSIHAVHFTHHFLRQQGWEWPQIDYLAVGEATRAAFTEVGIDAICPDDPRSEGVLALPNLQQVDGKHIVILRGNGGRDLMASTLTARGAQVHYCAAYERSYPPFDGAALVRHWQAAGLDSLLITSGELLQRLLALTPLDQRDWLCERLLVVPSPRVAAQAQTAGFTQITIAQGASNQALTAALTQRTME
ncbi:uroporphyrinogen-III synthase [Aeromonas cavernicola]|uniref:Uroporphyrinogen-III synthase n=1 Tax=Aeromonas cavernicola TaxID=1006623 RepID=A0A2H9U3M0_9GAMM|nr:uroporphyrinogen-III synthase [Aeromonas cavernicola]PJG58620.1 uroporphyrinogen III synthase [Aeromonas cavernicola]